MRGFYGFGAMGLDSNEFDQQLSYFKTTLLGLYKQKTKLVAERESLRFKYITQAKAKLSSIMSSMFSEVYATRSDGAEKLLDIIVAAIKGDIPMTDLQGKTEQGWGYPAAYFGGRLGVSFISPTSHIITEPFNELSDPNQSPLYKLYKDSIQGMNTDGLVNQSMFYQLKNGVLDQYAKIPFDLPPSKEWVAGWIKSRGYQNATAIEYYDMVIDLLSKSYSAAGGSFNDWANWIQGIYHDLIQITFTLIGVQWQIDDVESQLSQFVSDYASFSNMSISANDIMKELMDESQRADETPGVIERVVTNNESTPLSPDTVAAPMPAPKSSKLPWIAAAAGIFLLTRK